MINHIKGFISFLLVLITICNIPIVSAFTFGVGDYIRFGRYNGDNLVWRCATIDENGALMVCDDIVSVMSFDASTDGETERNKTGSSRWSTSSIRKWLNSTDDVVDYAGGAIPSNANVYLGKNGYSERKGFLSSENFTDDEKACINQVTLKTVISNLDISDADGGEKTYKNANSFTVLNSGFENAYYENTLDKMFLLSSDQIANMVSSLGRDSFYVNPTPGCVENSEYRSSLLASDKCWNWWLREPITTDSGSRVVCAYTADKVTQRGWLGYEFAYNDGIGVRPAFYLKIDNISMADGDGSLERPYRVGLFPNIECKPSFETARIGEEISLDFDITNAPLGAETAIIINGELHRGFNSGDTFTAVPGENRVTAVLYSDTGQVAISEEIVVYGIDTYSTGKIDSIDIDNWVSSDFLLASGDLNNTSSEILTATEGYELYLPRELNFNEGIFEISYDIMCETEQDDNLVMKGELVSLYVGSKWITPFKFNNGYIYNGTEKVSECFEKDKWYTIEVCYDFNRGLSSLELNGSLLKENVPLNMTKGDKAKFAKLSLNNTNSTVNLKNLSAQLKHEKFILNSSVVAKDKSNGTELTSQINKSCGAGKLILVSVVYQNGKMVDMQATDITLSTAQSQVTVVSEFPDIPYSVENTYKTFFVYPSQYVKNVTQNSATLEFEFVNSIDENTFTNETFKFVSSDSVSVPCMVRFSDNTLVITSSNLNPDTQYLVSADEILIDGDNGITFKTATSLISLYADTVESGNEVKTKSDLIAKEKYIAKYNDFGQDSSVPMFIAIASYKDNALIKVVTNVDANSPEKERTMFVEVNKEFVESADRICVFLWDGKLLKPYQMIEIK